MKVKYTADVNMVNNCIENRYIHSPFFQMTGLVANHDTQWIVMVILHYSNSKVAPQKSAYNTTKIAALCIKFQAKDHTGYLHDLHQMGCML